MKALLLIEKYKSKIIPDHEGEVSFGDGCVNNVPQKRYKQNNRICFIYLLFSLNIILSFPNFHFLLVFQLLRLLCPFFIVVIFFVFQFSLVKTEIVRA